MKQINWEEFYEHEAAQYDARRYTSAYGRLYRRMNFAAVARALRAHPAGTGFALDVASGTGHMLDILAPHCARIVATDLTAGMLAMARSKPAAAVTDFLRADAFRLPFADASFDLVSSSRFLHLFPLDRQQELIVEMARVLKPDGVLLVDFYNATPRRVMAPVIALYRWLRRHRAEHDYRVTVAGARKLVMRAGLREREVLGLGGLPLAPLAWLPRVLLAPLVAAMRGFAKPMAEQLLIVATKR
jgi:ubiquinone/menaquinone biosynthesis C-methylase UbiE